MEAALRAGVALYTAGDSHTAHEPWEEAWLSLSDGDDKALLQGLIQFTAAVHHAETNNWEGAVGLAERAPTYLTSLPTAYRGIDTDAVVESLAELAANPEAVASSRRPPLHYNGQPLTAADLTVEEIIIAATAVGEQAEAVEMELIETATEYAREEATTAKTTFIGLLTQFIDDREHRGLLYDRLRRKVERRESKADDVAGLFD